MLTSRTALPSARKRQFGTEKRTEPLPSQHPKPSAGKIARGRIAILLTIAFWAVYILYTITRELIDGGNQNFQFTTQAIGYSLVVTFLTFSALMYLIAREGAFRRFAAHVRVPRAELDRHFATSTSSITVLVPSYAEEPQVVRATLMSAVLQEFPHLRAVLLVDDPPNPSNPAALEKLQATRSLAAELNELFTAPRERFRGAMAAFEDRRLGPSDIEVDDVRAAAGQFAWAAAWLHQLAAAETVDDHVDIFFVEQVLLGLAGDLEVTARALAAAAADEEILPAARIAELYRRLAFTFGGEVDYFERKRYASMSHEANKAMNLNAYIGLMGGNYRAEDTPEGSVLIPVAEGAPDGFAIDDSDFLLTLDADSILLREYCLRLTYLLQQPGNERIAVTQTPYSSFRGAGTRIERLAAATTDVQHILHQGMSAFGATFWVGANAVIRKRALDDIRETEWIGGFEVHRYVQDRTVIEDTESSIDLGTNGWGLINYPERLSYSATPPDFGSLVVQRRRWANGGLLILPKFLRQVRERRRNGERVALAEVMLRINYMASIAWASFGLIFLLAFPYDGRLLSPLVLLAALPYFLAMASDLRYCGYRASDVLRIYGFNLILLPVNLAGVFKSLQQALTGKKIPFARTPKVKNRTASPALYVIVPLLIVAFSVFTLWRDFTAANWGNAAFAAFNATLASWAIVSYIGIGHTIADAWRGLTRFLYVETNPRAAASALAASAPAEDWRAVLYHGHAGDALPLGVRALDAVDSRTARERQAV